MQKHMLFVLSSLVTLLASTEHVSLAFNKNKKKTVQVGFPDFLITNPKKLITIQKLDERKRTRLIKSLEACSLFFLDSI